MSNYEIAFAFRFLMLKNSQKKHYMDLKITELNKIHHELGGKMVPFAGYEMPIQYKTGIIEEHKIVRNSCGLFDVSHMGQIEIEGADSAKFLSTITPTNFVAAENGGCKYTVLTNSNGGIIDDLIVTKISENSFSAVINAACAEKDIAWIKSQLKDDIKLKVLNKALIALQGPEAEKILQTQTNINLASLKYMHFANAETAGCKVIITRTGYTGEDGFEISIENVDVEKIWNLLCQNGAKPAGLGCRDSLRLEMGYPLYGHDIDDNTSPLEAGIGWVISKEHSGFIGADKIAAQRIAGITRKRIGLVVKEKIVAREGSEIYKNGNKIGILTSGGFSPSLNQPIGMGYFAKEFANEGEALSVMVRGKEYVAEVKKFPLIAARTKK